MAPPPSCTQACGKTSTMRRSVLDVIRLRTSPLFVLVLVLSLLRSATLVAAAETPDQAIRAYFSARFAAADGASANDAIARVSARNTALRSFTQTDLAAVARLLASYRGVRSRTHDLQITPQGGLTFAVYEL